MGGTFDVGAKRTRLQELERQTASPHFWNDPKAAQQVAQEATGLKKNLERFDGLTVKIGDLKAMLELAAEAGDAAMEREAAALAEAIESDLSAMELERMLSGPNDEKGAILSVNAGAGGTESCDWAEMLTRMYRMWADRRGFKNEVVDYLEGDQAGFKSATLTVEGAFAYGWLKSEIGVHRLVRISPFDANARRHTSFASVFVIPDVPDDVDIQVAESDLRIDTFRSSGAGGQHVNKTDSAVRLTHLPTGIVVACRSERSQHRNKETAMKLLKARLFEFEMKKRQAEAQKLEETKKDIEWGSQIRSYVLHPYKLVKDHRTGTEIGNAQSVLDGKLDELMRGWLLSKPVS